MICKAGNPTHTIIEVEAEDFLQRPTQRTKHNTHQRVERLNQTYHLEERLSHQVQARVPGCCLHVSRFPRSAAWAALVRTYLFSSQHGVAEESRFLGLLGRC